MHRNKNKSKKPQMSEMLQQMQEEELTEQQLIHKVNKLSRQPIKCPISNCAETIFPTSMLMHMCHKHAPYTVHAEMYDHLPLTLSFGPAEMAKDEVKCVATLLYGGIKDRAETQPGRTYMSMPNVDHFDSRDDARLKHYLPVMLLACRTTWFAQLQDKQLEQHLNQFQENYPGIYLFWLAAPATTRQLYYTLTVHDQLFSRSRSVVRAVRNLLQPQYPHEFMPHEDNYLHLTTGELEQLLTSSTATTKQGLQMELVLYENPLESTMLSKQSKDCMPRIKGSVPQSIARKLSLTKRPRHNAN